MQERVSAAAAVDEVPEGVDGRGAGASSRDGRRVWRAEERRQRPRSGRASSLESREDVRVGAEN